MSHSLQSEINYLTSLHGEGDDYEDGGAVGEVAGALEERKENVAIKRVSGEVEVVGQDLWGEVSDIERYRG